MVLYCFTSIEGKEKNVKGNKKLVTKVCKLVQGFGETPFGTTISLELWQSQLYDKVFGKWEISFALREIEHLKLLLFFSLWLLIVLRTNRTGLFLN